MQAQMYRHENNGRIGWSLIGWSLSRSMVTPLISHFTFQEAKLGLDTVELVLAIEEEFEISIEDEDAEKLTTPAKVADYVMSRIGNNVGGPCPSQVRFHRLRAALMSTSGIPRKEILLNAPLHEIMRGDTRGKWQNLRRAIGTQRFPRLKRTKTFIGLVVFGIPAIIVAPMVSAGISSRDIAVTFAFLLGLSSMMTIRMGTIIPPHLRTVESLVPFVGCAKTANWTREAVLAQVIWITSEQLGIDAGKIHEDSEFVRDLGAD